MNHSPSLRGVPAPLRPPAAHRAKKPTAALALSVGQQVTVNGSLYTIGQGAALVPTAPPPPPLPPLRPIFLQMALPAGTALSGRVTLASAPAVTTSVPLTWNPPLWGAPSQVTVPAGFTWGTFTIPQPTGITALTRQEVDAALSGVTLPLSWFWVPGAVPPPPPPPPPPPADDPQVSAYLDAQLQPITVSHPVTDELVIEGSHFGTAPGSVSFSLIPCSVIFWSDTKIIAVLPVSAMLDATGPAGSPPALGDITVRRPDGRYYSSGPVWRQRTLPPPQARYERGDNALAARLEEIERRVTALERRGGR